MTDPIQTTAWSYGTRLYATEEEAQDAAARDETAEVTRELRRLTSNPLDTERVLRAMDPHDRRGLLSVLRQVGKVAP